MSRIPLIHIPDGIYSVVSKCNNDEFHFNSHPKFKLYLEHLLECKKIFSFTLFDLVCMSNHVHELYRVPRDVTISDILQRVKGGFACKFNTLFGRTGHFWRNKPRYRIVQDEKYAIACMNYYHMNPVKAGMVAHPAHWPYSGYAFHELGRRDGLLGELLTALPGYDECPIDQKVMKTVTKLLERARVKFIGDKNFQRTMRLKYNKNLSDHK